MEIAERITRLGTETAFAVGARAATYAAQGNKVYPFHLGDMNLPTPANIIEAACKAMLAGKTGYCPNWGIPELREALAGDINRTHGTSYGAENVAIQPGGKPVIGKFMLSLMNPGDQVLYPNPGYPIYESMIEFHGGEGRPYGLLDGRENFELDIEAIEQQITPATRILVLNDLHNPSGAECSEEQLEKLAEIVLKHDLYVLCDEAYFDIRYEGKSRSFVSIPGMADRSIVLYTFSKKFAMTGWRLGAAIGPEEVIEVIAKLNVNDESCSNHFVQWAALEALTGDQSGPREIISILRKRRDVAVDLLNSMDGVSCYRPKATFYLFPDFTRAMANMGIADYGRFSQAILENTGVSVCTRLHFGRELPGETHRYLRFAYSSIDVEQIEEGLGKLKEWLAG